MHHHERRRKAHALGQPVFVQVVTRLGLVIRALVALVVFCISLSGGAGTGVARVSGVGCVCVLESGSELRRFTNARD